MTKSTRKIWHTVWRPCTVVECIYHNPPTRCVRGYHITDQAGTCLTCKTTGAHGGGMRRGPMKPAPPDDTMAPILMGHA